MPSPTSFLDAFVKKFNISDLENLAWRLSIPFDELEGKTRSAKAISLIDYACKNSAVDQLREEISKKRPSFDWDQFDWENLCIKIHPTSTLADDTRSNQTKLFLYLDSSNPEHVQVKKTLKENLEHTSEIVLTTGELIDFHDGKTTIGDFFTGLGDSHIGLWIIDKSYLNGEKGSLERWEIFSHTIFWLSKMVSNFHLKIICLNPAQEFDWDSFSAIDEGKFEIIDWHQIETEESFWQTFSNEIIDESSDTTLELFFKAPITNHLKKAFRDFTFSSDMLDNALKRSGTYPSDDEPSIFQSTSGFLLKNGLMGFHSLWKNLDIPLKDVDKDYLKMIFLRLAPIWISSRVIFMVSHHLFHNEAGMTVHQKSFCLNAASNRVAHWLIKLVHSPFDIHEDDLFIGVNEKRDIYERDSYTFVDCDFGFGSNFEQSRDELKQIIENELILNPSQRQVGRKSRRRKRKRPKIKPIFFPIDLVDEDLEDDLDFGFFTESITNENVSLVFLLGKNETRYDEKNSLPTVFKCDYLDTDECYLDLPEQLY